MKKKLLSKSKENQPVLDLYQKEGLENFGYMSSQSWKDDPRAVGFTLSRYKFVAKMMSGIENILEIGCGDAFFSRVVKQEVKNLSVSDWDPIFIDQIIKRNKKEKKWKLKEVFKHDMCKSPTKKSYEGIYAVDVFEHISKKKENKYLINICKSLKNNRSILILGCPSIYSQKYASKMSRVGHVNCKTQENLNKKLKMFFYNTFIFSMNDEVLHTGYSKMSNYYFIICINKKK